MSAGCVGYTVHPILIRAYFVLITQSQYLPTCIFLLYCALVCSCICLTHVRPTCFYPEEPMSFTDLCNNPGILWKERGEGRWIARSVWSRNTEMCCCTFVRVFPFHEKQPGPRSQSRQSITGRSHHTRYSFMPWFHSGSARFSCVKSVMLQLGCHQRQKSKLTS